MGDIEQELQELKNKIDEIYRQYNFFKNYKIICAILDKYNLTYIKLTKKEIANNSSTYIVEDHENEIHVYKESEV